MGGLVIQHNITAMNSNRTLNITTGNLAKSSEKLSSGYKINRAADDAAGLSISEKMRRQIRGLTQASRNCQDGISLIQIAEGSLNEVHDMLQRSNELAVKASNDTLTNSDRLYVEEEYRQLLDQIDKNAASTTFNDIHLFPSEGYSPTATSFSVEQNVSFNLSFNDNGEAVASDINISYPSSIDGVTTPGTGWDTLGEVISQTLIPNAVSQILTTFPSLQSAVASQSGGSTVPISLNIKYIDGSGSTLAYASESVAYSSNGTSYSVSSITLSMSVDKDDFSDSSVDSSTGNGTNKLESTIAHELMHTVMQYTMPMAMVKGFYPTWFTEGVAQLAGGGVATNWNSELYSIVSSLTSANDTSKDSEVARYLQKYTLANRPYGHGYLMSAYLGYLASSSSSVNSSTIASGMNTIMAGLLNGDDLGTVLKNLGIVDDADKYQSTLASLLSNASADSDITKFVRALAYSTSASSGGQGSIIGDLGLSDTDIINNSALLSAAIMVSSSGTAPVSSSYDQNAGTGGSLTPTASSGGTEITGANTLFIQAGSENEDNNRIGIKLFNMDSTALGLNISNMMTSADAQNSIDLIKDALKAVSNVRSYYGAMQNRLEHTIKNLDNVVENTTSAESQIRDTDMASEMVSYSNGNILAQAGQSMLAQANQSKQGVLSLLQ